MKISLPSLTSLLKGFAQVAGRFPLELLFALAGTSAAVAATYPDPIWEDPFWIKIIMCCNLGLVFSLSATTFSEARGIQGRGVWRWPGAGVVLLLAVGYFFTLPEYLKEGDTYRFFLISATGHLLVAVAPFSAKGFVNGFWHYNKALFLRFLTAVLYSGVLYLGLVVALLALDKLFGLDINDRLYLRLWLVIAGLFNTVMFLAGVPREPRLLEQETGYPRGLKIFTQFVLIPLVSIYVLILLAYEGKILVQWDLPRGWVSNLIIAFAVFGILSLLLVFPVRKDPENKWIGWYTRAFYWIVLPLAALLFLAIGTRISDYGFTVLRFIVLVTGCWLVFIALYFLLSKKENIKLVPASLIAVTLLTTVLAFPVSVYGQKRRLFAILETYQMMENGRMKPPADASPGFEERREITSIIRYLYDMHGASVFRAHADIGFYEKDPEEMKYGFTDSVMRGLHIEPVYSYSREETRSIYLTVDNDQGILLKGYDYHIGYAEYYQQPEHTMYAGGHTFQEIRDEPGMEVTLVADEKDSIRISLTPLINRLVKDYRETGQSSSLKPEIASEDAENDALSVKVYLHNLSATTDAEGKIDPGSVSFSAGYLIRIK